METRWGRLLRGALITEAIPDTEDLASLAVNHDPRLVDNDWVAEVSRQAAAIMRRMHSCGFVHNDFKWRNLLVDKQARLFIIDCPMGMFWPKPFLPYRIVKELAMLDLVAKYRLRATQRLRFYLDYRQVPRLGPAEKRQLRRLLRRRERRVNRFAPVEG